MKVLFASTTRHKDWGGPARYVRIRIHESVEAFRQAAEQYSPNGVWEDKAAGFHPSIGRHRWSTEQMRWLPIGQEHFAGIIDLCEDYLTNEIIVHECVHAGISIYRMDIKKVVNLGGPNCDREEDLAYIVGDLTEQVFVAIKEVADEGIPSSL